MLQFVNCNRAVMCSRELAFVAAKPMELAANRLKFPTLHPEILVVDVSPSLIRRKL